MQLTINLNEMTTQKRAELLTVLGLITPVTAEVKSNQPELPFEGEIDTTQPKKPKGRVKKETEVAEIVTETASEDTKGDEVIPEPTPATEKPSKAKSKVTLQALKEMAQGLVTKVSRDEVKGVIEKYAPKLSDVKESDYETLMTDLVALDGTAR